MTTGKLLGKLSYFLIASAWLAFWAWVLVKLVKMIWGAL